MAKFGFATGPWALVAAAGGLAVLGALGYVAFQPRAIEPTAFAPAAGPPDSDDAALQGAPAPEPPSDRAEPGPDESASPETAGEAEPQQNAALSDEAPDPQEAPLPTSVAAPRFDLVRAEADGRVLVAGTAAAGHRLRIDVDGEQAAAGEADPGGGFVLFLSLEVGDKARVLDLTSLGPDGSEYPAEESVILAPPPSADPVATSAPAERPAPAEARRAPGAVASADAAPTGSDVASVVDGSGSGQISAPSAPERASIAGGTAEPVSGAGTRAGLSERDVDVDADAAVQAALPEAGPATVQGSGDRLGPAPGEASPQVTAQAQIGAGVAPEVATEAEIDAETKPGSLDTPTDLPPRAAPTAARQAPAVLVARDNGVSLLQSTAPGTARLDRVVIDVISYDDQGTVTLEGRSAAPPPPIDRVRIYLDNAPVQTARIEDDGSWRLPLREVASGVYTLRVDQIDKAGNVVSRFETPFKREDRANLARLEAQQPAPGGTLDVSVITVQPGYTLWGIASDRYGDGFSYVAIFDANAAQIRDPDLIYPGQVFDLPDLEAEN